MMVCYAGKWMMESYDIVEIHMQEMNSGEAAFDPYKLLHINNNGAFNTTLMYNSYHKLEAKYHPNVVRAKNSQQ